jgi:hypothetical protein
LVRATHPSSTDSHDAGNFFLNMIFSPSMSRYSDQSICASGRLISELALGNDACRLIPCESLNVTLGPISALRTLNDADLDGPDLGELS